MEVKQYRKVGILTQPLHNNYGGLLQAYALQKTIKSFGHDAWIINRKYNRRGLLKELKSYAEVFIQGHILNNKDFVIQYPTRKEKLKIGKHTAYFTDKYISPITSLIDSDDSMYMLQKEDFDAYVVGSDQVWRPKYSPNITNFFLDFLDDKKKIKRIAYAASFGVSDWEFTRQETEKCSTLIKKFDTVSVRETTGVALCYENLGVEAIRVLDPTLLLEPQDYSMLIQQENEPKIEGTLMTYVLDRDAEKDCFIHNVANELNLTLLSEMQIKPFTIENRKEIQNCIFPPITKWLRGIRDAEFVITDSFHGCALSILFNKPFLAIGNERRGITRFESLLQLFGLEERLITDITNIKRKLILETIDWRKVNDILAYERAKSIKFLQDELKLDSSTIHQPIETIQ
ncbi:polysaccharide pyruvyl transferase family protein [Pontibacter sp. HSC-36F09]|uniref:polysaccharide pyruvyl transferase family protein n=1 Tax=Pontibacter sp. HSC-36F09 TaxID=2910966 RepID=UPI00209CFAD3|nr:hypothetical protein [Pontibacter sp. HSC-36F09]